ncbi:glycosyltransferase [Caulobacter vibrioides]|uniref:GT1-family glycosyltransferase n=1 Tax=Caulobacter vibrioides (strain NA1000 / CB15N) TaxID=565050 RepID=A0A0H3C3T2_CAUVN|nr:glycosyltransferase family 4 protein [Caulobacter vibrioides]YP_002515842.2 GT1-family glycosyltransferase [Caulobacter vibrioides NA1000]QBQ56909.1 glycosyltransferase [synthetic Caulobacter sp. 'ethensis']ACL93934.2 GT1-family glycosyltransferase [Caulobacter vibrioides NA1000]ATC30578.1 hypothetical protein CA607_02360 [Caulobacter vibrioides]AZH14756.1 glycosyltransferase [Caulobacter vibrioides]
MNILQIGSYLDPDLVGGAEISAANYQKHLTASGYKTVSLTWCQTDKGGRTKIVNVGEHKWIAASHRSMSPIDRGSLPQKITFYAQEFLTQVDRHSLQKLMEVESIDLLLIHSFRGLGYDFITALAELNKPTIFILHDLALTCMNKSMSRKGKDCAFTCAQCRITQHIITNALNSIDNLMIIGPSMMILNTVRDELQLKKARFEYLPNANEYNSIVRVRGNAPPPFKMGYFGRLEHDKGVDQLKFIVDAISQLYPVELHIAGDGSLKDLVTSWHGKDGIHFHGFVPSDRMVLLYEKIDCLLLPSMWKENFPGVAVQAIMTGAPVIGFDSGGISEIIEDGKSGFLAARGDFKGLACAVIKLIESPNLLNEMSKAALERSKQYDPKYLSAKMIEILSDFLKNGNSKALHA